MTKAALIIAGLILTSPGFSADASSAPAAVATAPAGMISLSLVEALAAMNQPQLAGIFSFVSEKNAPFAFADLIARDKKSRNRYLDKLQDDLKVAHGLTEWDHEVCASLVNLYGSPMAATFGLPDSKRMKQINDCVLAQTIPLEEIVARRKK